MKPRGARRWGDDHKVGRARERRGPDAPVKPHSHPDERPACPRCGAQGNRINKAGFRRRLQLWLCFDCRKKFFEPEVKKRLDAPTACPECGSDQIEQEADGTWVCWRCSWFTH